MINSCFRFFQKFGEGKPLGRPFASQMTKVLNTFSFSTRFNSFQKIRKKVIGRNQNMKNIEWKTPPTKKSRLPHTTLTAEVFLLYYYSIIELFLFSKHLLTANNVSCDITPPHENCFPRKPPFSPSGARAKHTVHVSCNRAVLQRSRRAISPNGFVLNSYPVSLTDDQDQDTPRQCRVI
jgi:hypothetical protein